MAKYYIIDTVGASYNVVSEIDGTLTTARAVRDGYEKGAHLCERTSLYVIAKRVENR